MLVRSTQSDHPSNSERRRRHLAELNGYFWIPCPVCGENFAGYEWMSDPADVFERSVPVPDEPGHSRGICPVCVVEGFGYPYDVRQEIWLAELERAAQVLKDQVWT
jgi:hypothetical protein